MTKFITAFSSVVEAFSSVVEGRDNDGAICELWRDHYSELLNSVGNNVPIKYEKMINNNFIPISIHEISEGIESVHTGKGPGPDGLTIEHIKHGGPKLNLVLARLFTLFLMHNILPEKFMDVHITPVVKDLKKDIASKANYRPIANASPLSKLFEAILKGRMENYVGVAPNQFGFTKKSGTDTCIYLIKEIIDKFRHTYHRGYVCMLDASKAFDRVNHSKLFNKLIDRGVPSYIINILMTWYRDQKLFTKWGDHLSHSFRCTNGIKQGGLLSALLFKLYLDDVSTALNCERIGCMIGGFRVNHIMYADDVTLISPTFTGMERLMRVCSTQADRLDITFNGAKSSLMQVTGSPGTCTGVQKGAQNLRMNGETVSQKQEVKYLGVILNNDGTDNSDILRTCRYIYAFGNSLIKGFGMCSKTIRIKLFKTYMYQMYCTSHWSNFKQATFQKLKVAYNSIFRRLMKVPRYMDGINYSARSTFVLNNTHSLPERMRFNIYGSMSRIRNSGNAIVQNLVKSSDIPLKSRIWRTWRDKLHVKKIDDVNDENEMTML